MGAITMIAAKEYGVTAKVLHWLIVALLAIQFMIGWFMPDIHRGMAPGLAMTWHISIGSLILALIVARFLWRLTYPVAVLTGNQIRTYRWCNPPRSGLATMLPTVSTVREIGASLFSDKCVRASL